MTGHATPDRMAKFYDKLALAAQRAGDFAEAPFRRLERWAYRRWKATRS